MTTKPIARLASIPEVLSIVRRVTGEPACHLQFHYIEDRRTGELIAGVLPQIVPAGYVDYIGR